MLRLCCSHYCTTVTPWAALVSDRSPDPDSSLHFATATTGVGIGDAAELPDLLVTQLSFAPAVHVLYQHARAVCIVLVIVRSYGILPAQQRDYKQLQFAATPCAGAPLKVMHRLRTVLFM